MVARIDDRQNPILNNASSIYKSEKQICLMERKNYTAIYDWDAYFKVFNKANRSA